MSIKKLFSGFVIISLMMTSLAGCTGQSEPPSIQLVPEGVTLLGEIQVSRILNDQDLINAYNSWEKGPDQPQTMEDALKKAAETTGLDLLSFSRAVVFGDVNTFEKAPYVGLILEGTFVEAKLITSMEEKSSENFTRSNYKGYKTYTGGKDQRFNVAFLGNKVLLFGTTKAVQDIIDVRKGDRKAVNGVILDTYNHLGDSMCRFSFNIPDTARQSLAKQSVPGSPVSTKAFASMDVSGLAFDKQVTNLTIEIVAHFLDAASTQDARDTLIGAVLMFKGMSTVPELKGLLGKIKVTTQDNWVTISENTTIPELEKLVDAFRK